MACALHLIAMITVLNQSVWVFDQTQCAFPFEPSGRFEAENQIFVKDYPDPLRSFILAHEFCHRADFIDGGLTHNPFIDEPPCYVAGLDGLINPKKYEVTERARIQNVGGIWS